jgi:DNA-binding transcriptional ArsR family regulator
MGSSTSPSSARSGAADRLPRRADANSEDRVFAAMASRVRRRILDLLRRQPLTTGQIAAKFRPLSRFAVMQHLKVLAKAKLVVARRQGRERHNYLNVVPIHQALARWVEPGEQEWAEMLGQLKRDAEDARPPHRVSPGRRT